MNHHDELGPVWKALADATRRSIIALYATVTAIATPVYLELTGPIGMSGALHAVASFHLAERETATVVRLSQRAYGELSEQTQANYSAGWQDLLGVRLKRFVEHGERSGIK